MRHQIGAALFATVNPHMSYWAMSFLVMLSIAGPDLAYTVCNLQICATVDRHNQALAGGIFNVANKVTLRLFKTSPKRARRSGPRWASRCPCPSPARSRIRLQ